MGKTVFIAIPVLLVGGTEMQTLNLVRVFAENNYAVTVCCYYEYDDSMVAAMRTAGAEVLLMQHERAKGLWHLAKGLSRIMRMLSPDIVHVQYIAPGFVPVLAAKLAGVKTIFASVHQPGNVYGLRAKILLRTAARICTAFFCVSRSAQESWFGRSELFDPEKPNRKRKHFTIYNAVDVDKIGLITGKCDKEQMREELQLIGKKVIGFVGRLRQEKGLDVLIDALPHVLKFHPDTTLLIVGNGPDGAMLKRKAEDLELSGHIEWVGQKGPEEVFELYSVMDVLVVPSRFEGFGLVAAEAMAAGLPIVAAKVDGLAEVIEDNITGMLVPPEDGRALAQALTGLLSDKGSAIKMGQKGQKRIKLHFSVEKFNGSILGAYKTFGV